MLQPGFIIMIDSNLSEMLLCSGRLFERGMEEEEIRPRFVCVCVRERLFRFPDDERCQGTLTVWPQAV